MENTVFDKVINKVKTVVEQNIPKPPPNFFDAVGNAFKNTLDDLVKPGFETAGKIATESVKAIPRLAYTAADEINLAQSKIRGKKFKSLPKINLGPLGDLESSTAKRVRAEESGDTFGAIMAAFEPALDATTVYGGVNALDKSLRTKDAVRSLNSTKSSTGSGFDFNTPESEFTDIGFNKSDVFHSNGHFNLKTDLGTQAAGGRIRDVVQKLQEHVSNKAASDFVRKVFNLESYSLDDLVKLGISTAKTHGAPTFKDILKIALPQSLKKIKKK